MLLLRFKVCLFIYFFQLNWRWSTQFYVLDIVLMINVSSLQDVTYYLWKKKCDKKLLQLFDSQFLWSEKEALVEFISPMNCIVLIVMEFSTDTSRIE